MHLPTEVLCPMETEGGDHPSSIFRLFTKESLKRIDEAVAAEQEKEAANAEKKDKEDEEKEKEEKHKPNPQLMQGERLPTKMGEFPPELFGKPIEELDQYYYNKYVCSSFHWFMNSIIKYVIFISMFIIYKKKVLIMMR